MLINKVRAWALGRFILHGVRVWLLASLFIGLIVLALLPGDMTLASRVALSWDVTALSTVVFVYLLARSADIEVLRERARRYDPSAFGHGLFIVLGACASIVATVWTIREGGRTDQAEQVFHLLLAASTIFLTWFAVHSVFALHYAHLYYGEGPTSGTPRGGFNFPRDPGDDTLLGYSDFLYFAICAGMTFEASDVQVTQRRMRKWVTFHTVLAFLYNTVLLALLVDIAATLI